MHCRSRRWEGLKFVGIGIVAGLLTYCLYRLWMKTSERKARKAIGVLILAVGYTSFSFILEGLLNAWSGDYIAINGEKHYYDEGELEVPSASGAFHIVFNTDTWTLENSAVSFFGLDYFWQVDPLPAILNATCAPTGANITAAPVSRAVCL